MASRGIKQSSFFVVVIAIVVAGLVLLAITRSNKQRHEREVSDYILRILPQLASWQTGDFRRYFNPAAWSEIDRKVQQQTLRRFAALGSLKSCGRVKLSNRHKHQDKSKVTGNAALRSFIIHCHYQNDDALVHLTLSGKSPRYRVEKIVLIARLFDAEGADRVEVQLPAKRKIKSTDYCCDDTLFDRWWEKLLDPA